MILIMFLATDEEIVPVQPSFKRRVHDWENLPQFLKRKDESTQVRSVNNIIIIIIINFNSVKQSLFKIIILKL